VSSSGSNPPSSKRCVPSGVRSFRAIAPRSFATSQPAWLRRHDSDPRVETTSGKPCCVQRGDLGRGANRALAGVPRKPQRAVPRVRSDDAKIGEHHVDLAGQQRVQRRPQAAVGHLQNIDSGGGFQQLEREPDELPIAARSLPSTTRAGSSHNR
jgi:hypothetical protein